MNNKKPNGLPLGKVVEDSFEGVFRQHYIIKNRNRDTAWFSIIDKGWPDIKTNIKKWLYSDESDISLSALNKSLLNPTCKAI